MRWWPFSRREPRAAHDPAPPPDGAHRSPAGARAPWEGLTPPSVALVAPITTPTAFTRGLVSRRPIDRIVAPPDPPHSSTLIAGPLLDRTIRMHAETPSAARASTHARVHRRADAAASREGTIAAGGTSEAEAGLGRGSAARALSAEAASPDDSTGADYEAPLVSLPTRRLEPVTDVRRPTAPAVGTDPTTDSHSAPARVPAGALHGADTTAIAPGEHASNVMRRDDASAAGASAQPIPGQPPDRRPAPVRTVLRRVGLGEPIRRLDAGDDPIDEARSAGVSPLIGTNAVEPESAGDDRSRTGHLPVEHPGMLDEADFLGKPAEGATRSHLTASRPTAAVPPASGLGPPLSFGPVPPSTVQRAPDHATIRRREIVDAAPPFAAVPPDSPGGLERRSAPAAAGSDAATAHHVTSLAASFADESDATAEVSRAALGWSDPGAHRDSGVVSAASTGATASHRSITHAPMPAPAATPRHAALVSRRVSSDPSAVEPTVVGRRGLEPPPARHPAHSPSATATSPASWDAVASATVQRAPDPPAATAPGPTVPASSSAAPADMTAWTDQLYEQLRRRLRRDLLVDRERSGRITDVR